MADFDNRLQQVISESPKIDAACKNLCSALIAESSTKSETDPGPVRSQLEWINTMKVFYRSVQEHELKDSPQYGVDHPQGDEQTALDRIEQLTRYRVIKACHDKVKSSGNKPGKYFGKKFFTWAEGTLQEIRKKAEAATSSAKEKEALVEFINAFEASLVDTEGEEDSERGNADLVWASDFTKALQARQKRREKRTRGQATRQGEEVENLKSLVVEHSAGNFSPRVEELHDKKIPEIDIQK